MVKQQIPQVTSPQLDVLNLRIPAKAQISELTPLAIDQWQLALVSEQKEFSQAISHLQGQALLGYDTEADPNFRKDEPPKPTAIIQLASASRCYLFFPQRLQKQGVDLMPLMSILANPNIVKVGAALRFDRQQLRREFSLQAAGLCDLVSVFHRLGVKNQLGVKTILAMLVNRQLQKSKTISRSRWSAWPLTEAQLDYACADAIAPLICYQALRGIVVEKRAGLNQRTQSDLSKLLYLPELNNGV